VYLRNKIVLGNVALGLLLSFLLIKTLFQHSPITTNLPPQTAQGIPADPAAGSAPAPPEDPITPLPPLGLFKTAEGTAALPPEDPVPAAGSEDLGLDLCGTIAGSPRIAQAVIRDREKKTADIYRIDDEVAGARIVRIERNRVVLQRENQTYVLTGKSSYDTAEESNRPAGSGGDPRKTAGPVETASVPEDIEPEKNSQAQAFENILNVAKIEPFIENGQVKGLRIDGVEQEPMAQFLGLKNGDVITTINGQLLTDKQKAFQVYKKVRSQPQLDMELLRDKKTKQISLALP